MKKYKQKYGSNLLVDYASKELEKKERIVVTNEDWIAVVPFWAVWPFETMVLPKTRRILRITDLLESDKLRREVKCPLSESSMIKLIRILMSIFMG